jgi:tRNA A-37 threonylcarbamoyl transferase component Bud32
MSVRIEAEQPYDAMLRALGLDHPDGWKSFAAGQLVNSSSRGFVRKFTWPADGNVYFFKLYRPGRTSKRIKSAFKRNPARREAANLEWLRERGFPAVKPVAWGCRRITAFVDGCFLVTRGEPGFESLSSAIAAAPARVWVAPLGRLVRRLHEAGFFARDLYLRNILVRRSDALEPQQVPPAILLLDLPNGHRLRPGEPGRRAAAVYDLATLDREAAGHLSRTDRLRFLRAYLGDGDADRNLLDAIEARQRVQVAKHERRKHRTRTGITTGITLEPPASGGTQPDLQPSKA